MEHSFEMILNLDLSLKVKSLRMIHDGRRTTHDACRTKSDHNISHWSLGSCELKIMFEIA